jgi:hypothetical protein
MSTPRAAASSLGSTGHALPPLPTAALPLSRRSSIDPNTAAGCYLINYSPAGAPLVSYDGTLRITDASGDWTASGDLYRRDIIPFEPATDEPPPELQPEAVFAPAPDPSAGIPILPRGNYRFYLHVTQIEPTADGFRVAFDTYRFSAETVTLLDGRDTKWPRENVLTASMIREPAPARYPSPDRYFEGDVTDEAGTIVGRLTMGFVSPYLRKATIEIDCVPRSELPLDNGAGVTWRKAFDTVGWDVSVIVSDRDIPEPEGGAWNRAEAHEAMAVHRGKVNLDAEWRYYVLAVRQIDIFRAERGIMFDEASGGPDGVPREGLMIASHWMIPDEEAWGLVRGMRMGATMAYFRTAVHETGHAMGLAHHNDFDTTIMRSTDAIAKSSTEAGSPPFPNNIKWSFASDDEHRLRHWPDLVVRPGGLPFTSGNLSPGNRFESDKHRLEVTPLMASVPLGAPVRVEVKLTNTSRGDASGPATLSLSSGPVHGRVIDRSGTVRPFSPLTINETTGTNQVLKPGESVDASLTLCGGGGGPLFPTPGAYRVVVEAHWRDHGLSMFSVGETAVTVTAAVDRDHAETARRLLTTPDTLLTLAFGGDHLTEGIAAIGAALGNEILRPHFAWIEAKRIGTRFGARMPDLSAAAALIDETTVMSSDEREKADQLLVQASRRETAPSREEQP